MKELKPREYMRYTLYHAITDARAKEYEYASNSVKISISLSHDELVYLYQCVSERKGGDDE